MNLAAPHFGGEAVPQLVQSLDDGIDDDEQQEIHGGKGLGRGVHTELFPVSHGKNDAGNHDSHPNQETEPTETRPHERQPCLQEAIGIQKRDAHGERIHQPLLPLLALLRRPTLWWRSRAPARAVP